MREKPTEQASYFQERMLRALILTSFHIQKSAKKSSTETSAPRD